MHNRIEGRGFRSQARVGLALLLFAFAAIACSNQAAATTTPYPTHWSQAYEPTPITGEVPDFLYEPYSAIENIGPDGNTVTTPITITRQIDPLAKEMGQQIYEISSVTGTSYNASDCDEPRTDKNIRQTICESLGVVAQAWKTSAEKLTKRFYSQFIALSDQETKEACEGPAAGCAYPSQKTLIVDAGQVNEPDLLGHEIGHTLLFEPTCLGLEKDAYLTINSQGYTSISLPPDQYPNLYYNGQWEDLTGKLLSIGVPTELITSIAEGTIYMQDHPDATSLEVVKNTSYLLESWTTGLQFSGSDYKGEVLKVAQFIINTSRSDVSIFGPLIEAEPGSDAGINGFLTNVSMVYYPDLSPSPLNGARALAELAYSFRSIHMNPESVTPAEAQAMCK